MRYNIILSAGKAALFAAVSLAGQLLLMTEWEKSLRNIMLASVGFNIVLSVALAPRFGVPGVAVAHVVAYTLSGVAAQYVVRREFGITTHLY